MGPNNGAVFADSKQTIVQKWCNSLVISSRSTVNVLAAETVPVRLRRLSLLIVPQTRASLGVLLIFLALAHAC